MTQASEDDLTRPDDDFGTEAAKASASSGAGVVDRRKALQRIGLAGGAAGAAPSVIGVFDNRAGAAKPTSALQCGAGTVTVPADRVLYFDIGGGGGGGASTADTSDFKTGGNGGSGAQVTGSIAAAMASYPLTVTVGMGATWNRPIDWWGDGGVGYRNGGDGGDNGNGQVAGSGGGGGGSSAIVGTSILIVAAGGGGAAGAGAGGVGHNGGDGDTNGSEYGAPFWGGAGLSGSNMGLGGAGGVGNMQTNGQAGMAQSAGNGGKAGDGGDSNDDGGGGGGGGGGATTGGGGGGGGTGQNMSGGGDGGGGGNNSTTGATADPIVPNGGGMGGAGATARNMKGGLGGQGFVRLYINMAGNTDPTESCIFPQP